MIINTTGGSKGRPSDLGGYMSNIKTIEGKVRAILYDVPATRNDDMKLYFLVCKECVKEKHGIEDISL